VSASLRDRRVRIYGYSNAGGDGFISAEYTFRAERWASVSQVVSQKAIVGTAPETRTDVVVDFDPSVDVRPNDLLEDAVTLERYFARGITINTNPPALIARGEKLTTEVFSKLNVANYAAPGALDEPAYVPSILES